MEDMPAARFFSYAERLVAYKGVVRMRAEKGGSETTSHHDERPNARSQSSQTEPQAPAEKKHFRDIKHNPELAQYFD